jgi:hypothetical protein
LRRLRWRGAGEEEDGETGKKKSHVGIISHRLYSHLLLLSSLLSSYHHRMVW